MKKEPCTGPVFFTGTDHMNCVDCHLPADVIIAGNGFCPEHYIQTSENMRLDLQRWRAMTSRYTPWGQSAARNEDQFEEASS